MTNNTRPMQNVLGPLGVHIIEFPTKRFGFVGTVPIVLGKEVPATTDDIRGGRSYTNANGDEVTIKFPTFETRQAAMDHATAHGVTVR